MEYKPVTVYDSSHRIFMFGEFTLFKHLVEKVWRMNRSAKWLLIVTTTLDGFSLANCRQFAKFTKFSSFYPPYFPAIR